MIEASTLPYFWGNPFRWKDFTEKNKSVTSNHYHSMPLKWASLLSKPHLRKKKKKEACFSFNIQEMKIKLKLRILL